VLPTVVSKSAGRRALIFIPPVAEAKSPSWYWHRRRRCRLLVAAPSFSKPEDPARHQNYITHRVSVTSGWQLLHHAQVAPDVVHDAMASASQRGIYFLLATVKPRQRLPLQRAINDPPAEWCPGPGRDLETSQEILYPQDTLKHLRLNTPPATGPKMPNTPGRILSSPRSQPPTPI